MEDKPLLDQLAEAHDEVVRQVLGPVKAAWQEMLRERPWEAVLGFIHAVDWKERWLVALLATQAALFLSVLALRRNTAYLAVVFCFGATVIAAGERINSFAAARWRAFAGQPYFDRGGAFFAAVVAAPLMVTLFTTLIMFLLQVIMYLLQVVAVMVEVKKRQLLHQRAAAAAAAAGGGGGGGGGKAQQSKETKKGR